MIREARANRHSTHFGSLAAALLLALGGATSTLFTQQVQECTFFEFNPPSASFDANGGTGSVTCDKGTVVDGVYTRCAWTAASNVTWIIVNSGATSSQSGFGVVQYTVQPNTATAARTGTITFSSGTYQNGTYTITQSGSGSSSSVPFAAAPASLTFFFQRGQAVPASQTLNVSSGTNGSAFITSATTSSGGTWLSVSPSFGTTGAPGAAVPLTVSVNTSGLTPGTYTGNIAVSQALLLTRSGSTGAIPPRISVPVTLTVTDAAPPTAPFTVTPAALIFYYQRGQALPAAQTLNVGSGTSGSQFQASVSENSGGTWLTVSPSSATSGSNSSPVPLSVSVNPGSLNPGIYTGNITLSPPAPIVVNSATLNGATTDTNTATAGVTTPVTLTISDAPPPQILTPSIFQFPFDPTQSGSQTQPLTITSPNGVSTPFTLTANVLTPVGAGWISFDKTGGTTPTTVNVTVNSAGLQPGRYVALMQISTGNPPPVALGGGPGAFKDATASGPTCVADQGSAIILDVGKVPLVGTKQIFFDNTKPSLQSAELNALGEAFRGLTPTVVSLNTTDCSWLSITPSYFGSTPASFDVTATTSNYPGQQLSGLFVFNTADNSTATAIPVEATSGASMWLSDQYAVALSMSLSAGSQPSQNVTIFNTNQLANSATITPTSDALWLSVSNQPMNVPGVVTLTATAPLGGLSVGTPYYGFITISGSGVTSPPLKIPVSLTVNP